MPELGEVAHAASILRRFLAGKTISSVDAVDDAIVFHKPLTHEEFIKRVTGKRVVDVGRHGKYFWIRFEGGLVALLHFGMAGWVQVKGVKTHFIVMENGGDKKANARNAQLKDQGVAGEDIGIEHDPDQVWPPKFYKFILKCDDGTEVAFTDARRLGRVRLIDAADDAALMKQEPLVRNGIDFSKSEQRWDAAKFRSEVSRRKVPIKSLMMDQALFAGVGNWIADEILYQARVHPEESSDNLDESQLEDLYQKLVSICNFVVQVEGNTAAFPDDWLMLYRWGKRRKQKQVTAQGHEVAHVSVGGRTSCYVPALQKKRSASVKKQSTAKVKPEEDEGPNSVRIKPAKRAKTKTSETSRVKEEAIPVVEEAKGQAPSCKHARGERAAK